MAVKGAARRAAIKSPQRGDAGKGAILSRERMAPLTPQEKGIRLAVWSLNHLFPSGMGMPARGKAALALRYDLPLLLLSAAALPIL